MINNIDRLTNYDKLIMIMRRTSFSYPTRTTIDFYKSIWLDEIKIKIGEKEILQEENETVTCWDKIYMNCKCDQLPTYITSMSTKLFQDIYQMPCETKENIADLICVFGSYLKKIEFDNNIKTINPEYIINMINTFFNLALRHKLSAHIIMNKNSTDIMVEDPNRATFFYEQFTILIDELLSFTCNEYSSLIIYMMVSYLGSENNKKLINALVESKCIMFYIKAEPIFTFLDELIKGDTTALQIIDRVGDGSIDNSHIHTNIWSSFVIDHAKRCLEENYEKNKVCNVINHGGIAIGDNVFDDDVNLNELVIELNKLSIDYIKDYIGQNRIISFKIEPKYIGYIKVREKLDICKVLMPKSGFYTIIRHNDITYLLFTLYGDNNLYGISFPSGFKGVRKLITFEIPANLDYKLEI